MVLGRAISLIESRNPQHQARAAELLTRILPHTGNATRIGLSGVPGVGKSTFIETLGRFLTQLGLKVAVLAIDPSSLVSGGSILGDKTRMAELAVDPDAYIRPSPTAGALGGVGRRTRETMFLCEAAGFDVVLVETVGVGQSETLVSEMVDSFVLLLVPGAGDQLQGIKRGILEVADLVVVNKADGKHLPLARRAQREYQSALLILRGGAQDAPPSVLLCSALEKTGFDELWAQIQSHRQQLVESGGLEAKRQEQRVGWMWSLIEDRLLTSLREHPAVQQVLATTEQEIRDGRLIARLGADRLLEAFGALPPDSRG